jgi:hypothetical protein
MARRFVVAIGVAIDHRHYLSLPFLGLFLYGFGYVGIVSLWQGGVGAALRRLFGRRDRGVTVVPPPAYPVMPAQAAGDVLVGDLVVAEAQLGAPETAASLGSQAVSRARLSRLILAALVTGGCSSAAPARPPPTPAALTSSPTCFPIPAPTSVQTRAPRPFALVQRIFDENCVPCHGPGADLDLFADVSWTKLVQQPAPASEACGGVLVVPGDPGASYLYQKLTNPTPCSGVRMPLGEFGPAPPLPDCVTAIVRDWIAEGAPAPPGDAGSAPD